MLINHMQGQHNQRWAALRPGQLLDPAQTRGSQADPQAAEKTAASFSSHHPMLNVPLCYTSTAIPGK